jgi:hypothetical protein
MIPNLNSCIGLEVFNNPPLTFKMPSLEYQRLIIAYHGCDESVVNTALRGGKLKPSTNDYDWLGSGIYFWEHGPARALEWAKFMVKRGKIKKPAVVGALIQLGNCFDLLDVHTTGLLRKFYPFFQSALRVRGESLPVNDTVKRLHRLDCAFLNWAIRNVEEAENSQFHTVRGVFIEGDPLYPNSQLFEKSHVQVAVRDPAAIIGFFYPAAVDRT